MVRLPEVDFLADVGFGGQSYTAPLRLELAKVEGNVLNRMTGLGMPIAARVR
jgi:arylamine N-acetyltransferase